jgi:hypothetical protein
MPQKSATNLVRRLNNEGQDFEWYPTTQEIIECVRDDFLKIPCFDEKEPAVLDVGAGDGRVLMALTQRKSGRFAIEKAHALIDQLDPSIRFVGADFHHQTLIDKRVDVVFSNPPYSDFVDWSCKTIREANAALVYLVIPQRWASSTEIQLAIKSRNAEVETIGSFDFLAADRAARAKVDVVRINLAGYLNRASRYRNSTIPPETDPFRVWFDDHFSIQLPEKAHSDFEMDKARKEGQSARMKEGMENALVAGGDAVRTLETLYNRELQKLLTNYKAMETLDADLLFEMGFIIKHAVEGLRSKISGLKELYWNELFAHLKPITNRLTSKTREDMLSKLSEHASVDFTAQNVYGLVSWAIKNANIYTQVQLEEFVYSFVDSANVFFYKSNQRTYERNEWRYNRRHDIEQFGLEYRIVSYRCGGISTSMYDFERRQFNGLSGAAYHFLMDLITIAGTLGFSIEDTESVSSFQWESGTKRLFHAHSPRTGKRVELFQVRAFMNGNMHFKMNPELMLRINVEFGRLKGWIRTPEQAAEDLGVSVQDATAAFGTLKQLSGNDVPLIASS